jgi:hypothetical protein
LATILDFHGDTWAGMPAGDFYKIITEDGYRCVVELQETVSLWARREDCSLLTLRVADGRVLEAFYDGRRIGTGTPAMLHPGFVIGRPTRWHHRFECTNAFRLKTGLIDEVESRPLGGWWGRYVDLRATPEIFGYEQFKEAMAPDWRVFFDVARLRHEPPVAEATPQADVQDIAGS